VILEKQTSADNPPTLFKSVGMAAFDLVAADLVYQKALENKIGIDVNL